MKISSGMTLGELIGGLGEPERAKATPKPKKLRETAGEPVLRTEDGSLTVYGCGYAVYRGDAGAAVLWVPECTGFTYRFTRLREQEKEYLRETEEIPGDTFLELPWEIALTLVGDHRVEANSENRKGDRNGVRAGTDDGRDEPCAQESEDGEDAFLYGRYSWRCAGFAENPESVYIRGEERREMLESLTEKQRTAFVLYFRDGFTQQEIADLLGVSQQTVNGHLTGALKRLGKLI